MPENSESSETKIEDRTLAQRLHYLHAQAAEVSRSLKDLASAIHDLEKEAKERGLHVEPQTDGTPRFLLHTIEEEVRVTRTHTEEITPPDARTWPEST